MLNNIYLLFYNLIYIYAVITIGNLINLFLKFKYINLIEKYVYSFALGNLFYSLIFIYFGYFHLLYPNLLLLVYLLPIIFSTSYFLTKLFLRKPLNIQKLFLNINISLRSIFTILVVILSLLPLIPHLFSFPTSWDVLAYHLTLPKLYLQQHGIVYFNWFSQTTNPIGIEALFSFGELANEPRISNMIVFDFVTVLIIYFLYGLKNIFKFRVLSIGLILFLFKKILYSEVSINAFIDFPLALYSFLLMINYYRFIKINKLQDLLLLIVFSLYVVSVKLSGIIIAMTSLVMITMYFITLKKNVVQGIVAKLLNKKVILIVIILLIPALILYANNYFYTGNPVFPFFNNIFKGINYNESDSKILLVDFKRQNLTLDMILKLLLHTGTETPEIILVLRESLFTFALVIFTGLGFFNKEKPVKYLSIFCLLVYGTVYSVAGFPAYRYALPVIPAMALISSVVFFDLLKNKGFIRLPLIYFFVLSLLIQITSTFQYAKEFHIQNTKTGLEAMFSDDNARRGLTYQDNWLAIDYVNKNLFKEKDRLLNLFDNRLYYYQVPAIYAEPAVFLFFNNSKDNNLDKIMGQLRKEKITYLVVNTNWGIPRNLNTELYKTFLKENASNVASYSGIMVYKLK
jgi:hypothetical protein